MEWSCSTCRMNIKCQKAVSKRVRIQPAATVFVSLSPLRSAASANCRANTRATHIIKLSPQLLPQTCAVGQPPSASSRNTSTCQTRVWEGPRTFVPRIRDFCTRWRYCSYWTQCHCSVLVTVPPVYPYLYLYLYLCTPWRHTRSLDVGRQGYLGLAPDETECQAPVALLQGGKTLGTYWIRTP
jgi:hypothetical protein